MQANPQSTSVWPRVAAAEANYREQLTFNGSRQPSRVSASPLFPPKFGEGLGEGRPENRRML